MIEAIEKTTGGDTALVALDFIKPLIELTVQGIKEGKPTRREEFQTKINEAIAAKSDEEINTLGAGLENLSYLATTMMHMVGLRYILRGLDKHQPTDPSLS